MTANNSSLPTYASRRVSSLTVIRIVIIEKKASSQPYSSIFSHSPHSLLNYEPWYCSSTKFFDSKAVPRILWVSL